MRDIDRKFLVLAVLGGLTLTGCGGGGGDGGGSQASAVAPTPTPAPAPSPTPSPAPTPTPAPVNQVKSLFTEGIYDAGGFNYTVNGVPQLFISKTTATNLGAFAVEQVYGAITGTQTPRLPSTTIEALEYQGDAGVVRHMYSNIEFSESADGASLVQTLSDGQKIKWRVKLVEQDIGGETVASQLKTASGLLIDTTLVKPATAFGAGSKAYTFQLTAESSVTAVGLFSFAFGVDQSALFGSGWCLDVAGQPGKMGVEFVADGSVAIHAISGTCAFKGLVPTAKGSWKKQALGLGQYYAITYPDAVKQGAWAAAFVDRASLGMGAPSGAFTKNSLTYFPAYQVAVGDTFLNRTPYFNKVALAALRTATGL